MFEWMRSKESLHKIISYNRAKAKKYGERISILKSYDQSDVFRDNAEVNHELERCANIMTVCERRIRRAEKYLA